MMRLLDRYILRELLIPLGYCLAGFVMFWVTFDLFAQMSDLQEAEFGLWDLVLYYWIRMPELLVTIMPVALLLAMLYTLTNHSRHHELTAIRAAGISLWRLSAPYFAVAALFSAGLFWLNEFVVPQRLAESARHRGKQASADARWHYRLDFLNEASGREWNIGAFHLDSHEMRDAQVSWTAPGGSVEKLFAHGATRTNGVWMFFGVERITYPSGDEFDPVREGLAALAMPEFTETPEEILSEIRIRPLKSGLRAHKEAALSLRDIINYMRLHPSLNAEEGALLKTQLHARLAAPWTCVVVVLISLPFGAVSGRRNAFVGVASSIFICFAFFVLLRFGLALGTGGYVPPWLAAWGPNLVFGTAGALGTWRVR